ncbi:MAG: FAD-dependent oxidoreductase, partial [Chloroflexi bacterium]|nr:FAD-dependent oxidoreductase [Chloroflexota bacterium]
RWTHLFRHRKATPFFGVGSIGRLKGFLERPDPTPHLYFCGDYLCGPHMEGAITSGLRAAEAVMADENGRRE